MQAQGGFAFALPHLLKWLAVVVWNPWQEDYLPLLLCREMSRAGLKLSSATFVAWSPRPAACNFKRMSLGKNLKPHSSRPTKISFT